jgi:hypothetical protein
MLLKARRGDAGDEDRVVRTVPDIDSHRRYLEWAGVAYVDDLGRRAGFHALRHTYGSMLAKAGVAPRVAMSLMRHTDLRLTMNVSTDPRIFDMAGAVEKLTAMSPAKPAIVAATGTDDSRPLKAGRSKSVSSPAAQIGYCSESIGKTGASGEVTLLTLAGGSEATTKNPIRQAWGKIEPGGNRTHDPRIKSGARFSQTAKKRLFPRSTGYWKGEILAAKFLGIFAEKIA